MIKKNVSTSRKLAELKSDSARLLWTWILPHLDVAGRFSGESEVIKGLVVPRLKHFTPTKVEAILQELCGVGLIRLYRVDGERYLEFRRFEDFQNLRTDREAESKIPEPIDSDVDPEESGTTPGELPEDSGITPTEVKLREGKLRAASSGPAGSGPETKLSFDFDTHSWVNITDGDLEGWAQTFPAVDVDAELRKMGSWLEANPTKRKSNYRRFIHNWLSRAQDRGGSYRAPAGAAPFRRPSTAEVLAEDERYCKALRGEKQP